MEEVLELEANDDASGDGTSFLAAVPAWAHPIIAVALLTTSAGLWRLVSWRRHRDLEYARLELYEDRPFAFAPEELEPSSCVTPASRSSLRYGCSDRATCPATPITGTTVGPSSSTKPAALWEHEDDVARLGGAIRDALRDDR